MPTITVKKENEIVASEVMVADRFFKRLIGLSRKKSLHPSEGLLIKPCGQIHTYGMKFPIDAVFLSKDGQILHIERYMLSGCVSSRIKKSKCVLELCGGIAHANNLQIGDKLTFVENWKRQGR